MCTANRKGVAFVSLYGVDGETKLQKQDRNGSDVGANIQDRPVNWVTLWLRLPQHKQEDMCHHICIHPTACT